MYGTRDLHYAERRLQQTCKSSYQTLAGNVRELQRMSKQITNLTSDYQYLATSASEEANKLRANWAALVSELEVYLVVRALNQKSTSCGCEPETSPEETCDLCRSLGRYHHTDLKFT